MEEYLEIIATCVKCDVCRLICPEMAVIEFEQNYAIETWSCTLCQLCVQVCPVNSIKTKTREALGH